MVVLHEDQLRGRKVTGVPLLAVEVLSPSTRAIDSTLKRHVFEQAGVPSYWLLDPEGPTLTVLQLVDGTYREVAVAADALDAELPFPVRIVLADLAR